MSKVLVIDDDMVIRNVLQYALEDLEPEVFTAEKGIENIRERAGMQFDPCVVDAFISNLDEIKRLRLPYK